MEVFQSSGLATVLLEISLQPWINPRLSGCGTRLSYIFPLTDASNRLSVAKIATLLALSACHQYLFFTRSNLFLHPTLRRLLNMIQVC